MENLEFSDRRVMNLGDLSEDDVKSNASSSSSSRRRAFVDRFGNGAKMKSRADKWLSEEEDIEVDKDLDELNRMKMEKDFEDLRPWKSPDWKGRERVEVEGFQRGQGANIERRRYSASKYVEEGPSEYRYGDSFDSRSQGHGFDNVDYNGGDRVELLRKLEDLTEQLRRSDELGNNPREKAPHRRRGSPYDPYSGSEEGWFSDSSSGANRPFVQFPGPHQHIHRPSYMNSYADPSGYTSVDESGNQRFYHPATATSHVQGVEDPFRSQLPRRGPLQAPTPVQPRRYMAPMEPSENYAPNMNNHHVSCTCYACYNKSQVPQPQKSVDFGGQRLLDVPTNPVFYHREHLSSFGSHDFDPRAANMPPLRSQKLDSHPRWPGKKDSEEGSFVPRRPTRMQPENISRFCLPMTGGAPLLTCYNCSELLQVPNKVLVKRSNPKKLRCGACSTIIVLGVSKNRFKVPVYEENAAKVATDNHIATVNYDTSNAQKQTNRASMTFSSEDYDHSAYDFQSMDREPVPQNDRPALANAKVDNFRSASSRTSEDEGKLSSSVVSKQNSVHAEMLVKDKSPLPPPAGSSSQNDVEYSDKYHKRNQSEYGNTNRDSKQDATAPNSSEATEIEISSAEFGNTGSSLDSGEPSREGNRLGALAGFSRRTFEDFERSYERGDPEMANVTVNGHLIPDRLIEKAAKVAGPIQPGHYWYDYRAGFWGVIGSPCLGIIPPFIEEFHHPLPENCANGNTSVFVNGRELHQKDLNLLSSRGLPRDRNRSYIVEISGRVLDEYTGGELQSLGKLAPTIERVKRGFGMKPPKSS